MAMFLSCSCWAGVKVDMVAMGPGTGREESAARLAPLPLTKGPKKSTVGGPWNWERSSLRGRYCRDWEEKAWVGRCQDSGKRFRPSRGSPSAESRGGVNWFWSTQAALADRSAKAGSGPVEEGGGGAELLFSW